MLRFHHIVMLLAACAVLGLCVIGALKHGTVKPDTATKESVARVIDGDTVQLGNKERVRLLGIDCPELPSEPGKSAREQLSDRLMWGGVQVERHGHDRYGRTLAYIDVAGQDVGLEMLQWCAEVSGKYPHPRQEAYKKAAQ